ncbi:hypothetical protein K435DRAFT_848439 [Dendrothele bispora CBS 962.96]|uniref:Mid2 domain-containing protein n=1 Tax=Dendrothele bispora (strain CBS 962.96) TaxID=1314807 RepID=A0A4S8MV06_DENBC|nr:hypothetical protein K435DRAFT_848439 [Dendrothele bispora CBS 962.96]
MLKVSPSYPMRLFLFSLLCISSAAALPILNVGGSETSNVAETTETLGDDTFSGLFAQLGGVGDSIRNLFCAFLDSATLRSVTPDSINSPSAVHDVSFTQPIFSSVEPSPPFYRRAQNDTSNDDHSPIFAKVLIIIGGIVGGLTLTIGSLYLVAHLIERRNEKGTKRKIRSNIPSESPFEPTMESYNTIESRSPSTSAFQLPVAHDPFADHYAVDAHSLDVPRSPRPRSPRPSSPPV